MKPRVSTNKVLLLLLTLMVLLGLGTFGVHFARAHYNWKAVAQDLENIYQALGSYEHRNGSLPELALYPSEPLMGEDSIRFALSRYIIDPNVFVSPLGHQAIRRTGLTYIWNPELNGSRLTAFEDPVWVLMDVQAVDPNVRRAHRSGYAVLYSDGRVERVSDSPFNVTHYQ